MTNELYWDSGDASLLIKQVINENVVAAIRYFWEEDAPVAWVEVEDDRLLLTVSGPGKPTNEDPAGVRDVFTVNFDILEELTSYASAYLDMPGPPRGDDQISEAIGIARQIRKLSSELAELAARCESQINQST